MDIALGEKQKMSKISNWYEKLIKEMGYNGCRNCKHQIEPLRTCEWHEHGGMGVVLHLICPRWEKRENAEKTY
jgi:hypothetical protein